VAEAKNHPQSEFHVDAVAPEIDRGICRATLLQFAMARAF